MYLENKKKNTGLKRLVSLLVFFLIVGTLAGFGLFKYLTSPTSFEGSKRITIPEGYSLIQTGNLLEQQGLVHSGSLFRGLGQWDNVSIKAGTYLFEEPESMQRILDRLETSDYGKVYTTVTLPEGLTIKEMSMVLESKLEAFDQELFLELTKGKEGYLFPDTYQFLPDTSTETIVKTLTKTFQEKIADIQKTLTPATDFNDIVIMASLIEKEAGPNPEEQKIVSGILWKRIAEGMLLQVDAPFVYVIDKGSAELRLSDLRKDGPYNTYTRTGLTPTPIGNPGLSALQAAANPVSSPYYFYLHAPDGHIHYGVTHRDHINNKNAYLR